MDSLGYRKYSFLFWTLGKKRVRVARVSFPWGK
jgi:hypothetical protein